MFKGTIVEQSLTDISILERLNVLNTMQVDDWTIHDVVIDEKDIASLSNALIDGPWYMHFWSDDRIIVVFKNEIFELDRDDKNTWKEAVEYGKGLGIPEKQLDFLTE